MAGCGRVGMNIDPKREGGKVEILFCVVWYPIHDRLKTVEHSEIPAFHFLPCAIALLLFSSLPSPSPFSFFFFFLFFLFPLYFFPLSLSSPVFFFPLFPFVKESCFASLDASSVGFSCRLMAAANRPSLTRPRLLRFSLSLFMVNHHLPYWTPVSLRPGCLLWVWWRKREGKNDVCPRRREEEERGKKKKKRRKKISNEKKKKKKNLWLFKKSFLNCCG